MESSVEIDGDALEGVSGNHFDNRHGVFHAGNNARSDMTYRFPVDGKVQHTVTVDYGVMTAVTTRTAYASNV